MSGQQTMLICLSDDDLQKTPTMYTNLLSWSKDLGVVAVHILVSDRCGIPGTTKFEDSLIHSNVWDYSHLKAGLSYLSEPDWVLVVNANRIPNFMLLEMAYSEFLFTPYPLKHLTRRKFKKILSDFRKRERRFGQ